MVVVVIVVVVVVVKVFCVTMIIHGIFAVLSCGYFAGGSLP